MQFAGFWRRLGALFIDLIVMSPLIILMDWLQGQTRLAQIYLYIPYIIFGLWFHVYLVKRYGGSPGKILLNIKIIKTDGTAVDYKAALIRYACAGILGALLSAALASATLQITDTEYLSLGSHERVAHLISLTPHWYNGVSFAEKLWLWSEFIVMFTNKQRRALHDFMAGTAVIHA